MKKLLFFSLLLTSTLAMAPVEQANLSAITAAIGAGNADALGKYFDANVEVAVKDTEKTYSKAEAIKVVKEFFAKNKPSNFKQVHQGASKGQDSKYVIGNLTANTGSFRVYVFMKMKGSDSVIQEIRFD
ncbi:MAG TPA: DUF4783 domain-containing protein [Bacteroidetes bacterium]|nr:DUF4783 domain-containing protein [Bacteroidota bacterium]